MKTQETQQTILTRTSRGNAAKMELTAILESPNREPYYQCIPGWTIETSKNNSTTNYPCGSAKDPELHYPYKPNTISSTLLPILTFGPWIFTIIVNMLILYCSDPMYRYKAVLKNIEILLRMVLFSCCGTEVCSHAIFPIFHHPCTQYL